MKILITNQHLVHYAGTELYVYTLGGELQRQGHDVVVFSPLLGEVAARIREAGIRVVDDLEEISSERFDVIHGHHRRPTLLAFCFFPFIPLVYVSHGFLPRVLPFEGPPEPPVVVERYVAVSEEAKANLVDNSTISERDIEVVANPVDVERFEPQEEISQALRKVLLISSNKNKAQKELVEQACSGLGLDLEIMGWEKRVWNVEDYVNEADLVVSLGRGAMEGLACGRAVVVCGGKGCDGMITEGSIDDLLETNLSGRRYGRPATVETLIDEFQKYDPRTQRVNRRLALERFDSRRQARKLVGIYQEAIENFPRKEASLTPGRKIGLYKSYLIDLAKRSKETEVGVSRAEIARLQEEVVALRDLVKRYEQGRFIRTMAALHRLAGSFENLVRARKA